MGEAILRKYAGDHFEIHSAGIDARGIHPNTIKVMEEAGYDLSDHFSKTLDRYLGKVHFGILITVCQEAEDQCPIFPSLGTKLYWNLEDPSKARGSEEEVLDIYRRVRDQLDAQIRDFLVSREIPISKS